MQSPDSDMLPNGDGTITYDLKHPLQPALTSSKLDPKSIKLRDVYVSDVEAMEDGKTELGRTMVLIAQLSGWDIVDVRRLRFADYTAIAGVVAARMGKEDPGIAALLSDVVTQLTGETA